MPREPNLLNIGREVMLATTSFATGYSIFMQRGVRENQHGR